MHDYFELYFTDLYDAYNLTDQVSGSVDLTTFLLERSISIIFARKHRLVSAIFILTITRIFSLITTINRKHT